MGVRGTKSILVVSLKMSGRDEAQKDRHEEKKPGEGNH